MASGFDSTVGGGDGNVASGSVATVAGGINNVANGQHAAVGGGVNNVASGQNAAVGGGVGNRAISDGATVGGGGATRIGGGNTASGQSATVGGGEFNTASGLDSTVPGGGTNFAGGDYSFAAGRRATANHSGAFVWADQLDVEFASTVGNQFSVRAIGDLSSRQPAVRFVTLVDLSGTPTAGVQLAQGGSSWQSLSARDAKANFAPVDGRAILEHLAAIPIETWNYRSQPEAIRHLGPMAQDFYAAFDVGEDDRHITAVDAEGVALAASQALYQLVQEQDAATARLAEEKDAALAAQQAQLGAQQDQIAALQAQLAAQGAELAALKTEQAARQGALAARLAALERAVEP
jgi:hypothetical protein